MLLYAARRLLSSLVLLLGVITLTFVLMHLAPGDPIDLLMNENMTQSDFDALRARYGLDRPLQQQYLRWIEGVAQGDLGISLRHKRPVRDILDEAIPITLRLAGLALILDLVLGIIVGVVGAARRGRFQDQITTLGSLAIFSVPSFWLGLMLQLVFAYKLRWFPTGGTGEVPLSAGVLPWFVDGARHLAMPVAVLGISGAGATARFMRSSMIDALSQDYIRTARAKGLPPRVVLFKHAFRNAAIPIVTLLGLGLPFLLSGAAVTEVIFSWPGMGRVTVDAIFARDYPVILATTLISGAMVILGSLLADLAYAWIDPRLRRAG